MGVEASPALFVSYTAKPRQGAKSMPSALPFQPASPCSCCSRQALVARLHLTSCGQTSSRPHLTLLWLSDVGRTEQGAVQRGPGPHTQGVKSAPRSESLEPLSGCLNACVDARGGRGASRSPSRGAGLQGALRNRPTRPCFPP